MSLGLSDIIDIVSIMYILIPTGISQLHFIINYYLLYFNPPPIGEAGL